MWFLLAWPVIGGNNPFFGALEIIRVNQFLHFKSSTLYFHPF